MGKQATKVMVDPVFFYCLFFFLLLMLLEQCNWAHWQSPKRRVFTNNLWINCPSKRLSKQIFLKLHVSHSPSALTHAGAGKREAVILEVTEFLKFYWNMFLTGRPYLRWQFLHSMYPFIESKLYLMRALLSRYI